jgi:hypothetical protein
MTVLMNAQTDIDAIIAKKSFALEPFTSIIVGITIGKAPLGKLKSRYRLHARTNCNEITE